MTANRPAEQTAVYRGSDQAGALQQFAVDAERARAAGYVPISQAWTEADTVLTVRFSLAAPDVPVWVGPDAGTKTDPDAGTKKSRSKVKIAVAAVVLVVIGLIALGGAVDESPPTGGGTAASDAARWGAFKVWMTGDFRSMAVDMASLEDRANAGDIAGALAAADVMGATATRHLAYMSAHPAAYCYSALYDHLRSALTSFQSASRSTASGNLEAAITTMTSGNTSMTEATGELTGAEARCTA